MWSVDFLNGTDNANQNPCSANDLQSKQKNETEISFHQNNQTSNSSDGIKEEEYLDENGSVVSQDYANSSSEFGNSSDSRRRYRCNICSDTFPWHGDLTDHLRVQHGVTKVRENVRGGKAGSFCCSKCKYVAKYQSELRRHMRLHFGVKPFACEFCSYKSAWKGDLKRHMESHHKGCFSSDNELNQIMAKFKNNAGTCLNQDGDNFEGYLNDSQRSSENSVDIMTTSKPYHDFNSSLDQEASRRALLSCDQCNYSTSNQSKFDSHHRTHEIKKVFKCSICDLKSDQRNYIVIHLQTFHSSNGEVLTDYLPVTDESSSSQPPTLPFNYIQTNAIGDLTQKAALFPQNIFQLLTQTLINNKSLESMLKTDQAFCPPPNLNLTIPKLAPHFKPEVTSSPTDVFFPTNLKQDPYNYGSNWENEKPLELTTQRGQDQEKTSTSTDDQWKRFKCSACGHRSNWKWDINKHIRVAHPDRRDIENITLDTEEAKRTYEAYMERAKFLKRRSLNPSAPRRMNEDEEGYFRPFKCTSCGHRSNWEWDIKRHIRNTHNGVGSVFKMSSNEAKSTIAQYKQQQRIFYAKIRQNSKRLSNKMQPLSEIKEDNPSLPLDLSRCPLPTQETPTMTTPLPEKKFKLVDKITAHMANCDFSAFKCPLCERWFNKWSSASLHFASHKNAKVPLSRLRAPRSIIGRRSFPLSAEKRHTTSNNALSLSIERIKLRTPMKPKPRMSQAKKRLSCHVMSNAKEDGEFNMPAKRRQSLAPVSMNVHKKCLKARQVVDTRKERLKCLLSELNETLDSFKGPESRMDLNDSNEENKFCPQNLELEMSQLFEDSEIASLWQRLNTRLKS